MKLLKKNWLLLTLILFSLTPLLWFFKKSNVLIDGVDTNFPLNPAIWLVRRLYAWNDIANAGINTSSNVAGIFFHTVQTIPYLLGLNIELVEILSLVFWFSTVVFSAYIFARLILPKSRLSQLLFVCLYSFNTYLFNTWENVKVSNLALVIGIPLFLSVLLAYEKKLISLVQLVFFTALAALVVSGAGVNPAYFLAVVLSILLWILISAFGLHRPRFKGYWSGPLLLLGVMFLVNVFWIVPTLQYLFFSEQPLTSINSIGFTDWVNSLSENTSILNVLRMQGAWDWYTTDSQTGTPLYIPYSVNYFHQLPFLFFSFLLPALAVAAFLLNKTRDNSRLYLVFGAFLVIGVFLGVGTHRPTGALFVFFDRHLPFFSFFRSPWYIFAPLVAFSTAGLIGLLASASLEKFDHPSNGLYYRRLISLAIVGLIIGNLFYSYPQVTGRIFRPGRADGFYIHFPPYVFQAQNWLQSRYRTDQRRIISYPGDSIEQFRWGYRAPESILELFSPYELLFNPLNDTNSSISLLIQEYYRDLNRGALMAAETVAGKLNIGLLFVKDDQSSLAGNLSSLTASLPHTDFGKWHFYELNSQPGKIFAASNLIGTNLTKESIPINAILDSTDVTVNTADSVVKVIPDISQLLGQALTASNSQVDDLNGFVNSFSLSSKLQSRDLAKVNFTFNVKLPGFYQPVLERYKLESFGIDPAKDVYATLDQLLLTLHPQQIDDSYVYFSPLNLQPGDHVISFRLQNENLIAGSGNLGGFSTQGRGEFQLTQLDQGDYLTISNLSKRDTAAVYQITDFNPKIPYLIQVRYNQIYGSHAQVEAFQSNGPIPFKSQAESLPDYPGWEVASFYFTPVDSQSSLQIILTAPMIKDPLGTTVRYANLSVEKVFTNSLFFLNKSPLNLSLPAKINYRQESPVLYTGEIRGVSGPQVIVFSENYSPDWEITLSDQNGQALDFRPPHFSADAYANAWYIQIPPGDYKFKVYNKTQRVLNTAFIVSVLTLAAAAILCVLKYLKVGIRR